MNCIVISHVRRALPRLALLAIVGLLAGCSHGGNKSGATRYGSAEPDSTGAAPAEQSAQPSPSTQPSQSAEPARAARPESAVLPAGTHIVAALQSSISTASARAGDKIVLRTLEPVEVDGRTVVPTGSTIDGEVTYAKGAGRIAGAPALTLRFVDLRLSDGRDTALSCDPFRVVGKSAGKESLEEVGGGAAAGALVGGLLGHGGGALKGAAVGGILGTGVAVATKGHQIELPAGQRLSVDLAAPVTLPRAR